MQDDAAYFQRIIESLADQGRAVVIVTHSYGGVPGTESAKGLSKTDRQAAGKDGGVVGIVYLAAIVPEVGQSVLDRASRKRVDYVRCGVSFTTPKMTRLVLM
jgi:hypothetical protein